MEAVWPMRSPFLCLIGSLPFSCTKSIFISNYRKMKNYFLLLRFLCLLGMTACSSKDHDVLAVEQLTHRLIPQYADRFVFEIVPEEDRDYYSLESKDGKIHISGNNANSMAAGLNYYLKYYCLTTVSWYADIPVEMPDVLLMVEKPVVVEAKVDNRFFLIIVLTGIPCLFGNGRTGSVLSIGWR